LFVIGPGYCFSHCLVRQSLRDLLGTVPRAAKFPTRHYTCTAG
jgi:hypothetical protein